MEVRVWRQKEGVTKSRWRPRSQAEPSGGPWFPEDYDMTAVLDLDGTTAEVCELAYEQATMALGDVVVLGAFEDYEVYAAAPCGFERVPLMMDDWEQLRLRFSSQSRSN